MTQDKPIEAETVRVVQGEKTVLMIVGNGKLMMFALTRAQLFGLMESGMATLRELEA